MTTFKEGDRVRDKMTHESATVEYIYGDGWLLIHTADGEERHVEPEDIELDPDYHPRRS
jgi:hypothetical protein